MAKNENLSHISCRSVRISKGEDIRQLLGTGVLLTRKESHTVWVLTCCHVLQEEDKSAADGFHWITDIHVENKRLGCEKITLKITNGEHSTAQHTIVARGTSQFMAKSAGTQEDWLCFRLNWKDWMESLPDTRFGEVRSPDSIQGYGFLKSDNDEYKSGEGAFNGGKHFTAKVGNAEASDFFTFEYDGNYNVTRDKQMTGFSGMGLWNGEDRLVGIVCGPYADEDSGFKAKAVPIKAVEDAFLAGSRSSIPWESLAMVWCVVSPAWNPISSKERYSPVESLKRKLNLFKLLKGIKGSANVFLLNAEGEKMNRALRDICAVIPDRKWQQLSSEQDVFPSWGEKDGMVCTLTYEENSLRWASQMCKTGMMQNGTLLVFNLDLTRKGSKLPAEHPGDWNLEALQDKISELTRKKQFYLLSTSPILDEIILDPIEEQINIDTGCTYEELLKVVERKPKRMKAVIEKCTQHDNPQIRAAGCRLELLYRAVSGQPLLHTLEILRASSRSSGMDEDMDWQGEPVYSAWKEEEKEALLWYLFDMDIMPEEIERMAPELEKLEDIAYLWEIASKPVWTQEDTGEILEMLASVPSCVDMLLDIVNQQGGKSGRANSSALLTGLRNRGQTGLYWVAELCCRWGIENFLQDSDCAESSVAAMLLNPEPDMSDMGRWQYVSPVRDRLLP